jgi:arylsulfatase A-like enzyme
VFTWGNTLPPTERTIADICRDAGYRTGFFGKWHLGPVQSEAERSPGGAGFDTWVAAPNYFDNNPILSVEGEAVQFEGESSMIIAEQASDFITEAINADDPFLAFVWTANPHSPYVVRDELKELYSDTDHAGYYGEVTATDIALSRLREELRSNNIADNTLLWFTSDNGPREDAQGPEYELRGSKSDVYEGGVRVPAVIEWPNKIPAGERTEVRISTSDFLPTVANLIMDTWNPDRELHGVSLEPLFEGEMAAREKPMGFWYALRLDGQPANTQEIMQAMLAAQSNGGSYTSPVEGKTKELLNRAVDMYDRDQYLGPAAWLDGEWKLEERFGGIVLYHLASDPGETQNLVNVYPERVEQMTEDLYLWKDSIVDSMRQILEEL